MRIVALVTCLYLSSAAPAFAYVDPGFGSLLLQVIAGVAFGAMFYLRQTRDWIMRKLGLKSDPERPAEDASEKTSG